MSDENNGKSGGAGAAGGLGVAFVATRLIDVCFYGGMMAGGPIGAGVGLCVAVGLLGLGVHAAVKSGKE